jgi:preprotein translocase subunit YajC
MPTTFIFYPLFNDNKVEFLIKYGLKGILSRFGILLTFLEVNMFSDIVFAMTGAPKDAGDAGPGALFSSFLPLILIFAIFYFLLIRPQSKKAKDHKKMLEDLKKGDKILTSGGIYGLIESIEGDTVAVKIAENVRIKVSRSAIAGIREK